MKLLERMINRSITGITGLIGLSLGAIAAFWNDVDHEQLSNMAHLTAYALLWVLWALTATRLVIKAFERGEEAA